MAKKALTTAQAKELGLLVFSKANRKIEKGYNGRKMYSFGLPAGHTCPFAKDCLSKSDRHTGKITDGPETEFRCYAASMESFSKTLRDMLWHNFELLKSKKTAPAMANIILHSLPQDAEIIRIHTNGDFFNREYMRAWVLVAKMRPDILFYAYTKSIGYWVDLMDEIPANLKLNASRGGRQDALISANELKEVVVVYHPEEAEKLGLEIDHDDTHAYMQDKSFALVLHGTQPKGTEAAEARKRLKNEGLLDSYKK